MINSYVMQCKSNPKDHINAINNIISSLLCEKLRHREML